ncbi:TRAP transporter small permease [Frigidibacter sp. ROC022]|uniref:TRAP transporter small permease n=1 Tax=Frigidibacter sp. ROC022 TaxID=2971796 RepID=UPI00215B4149|nr:TRAP transporter small permease [Frigidibacter sp. ROC022]MCR8726220.1 TRAP transporter small permease [Frigidibacter sp. ROC022]
MRKALDFIYAVSQALAALAICLIVALVTLQVSLNLVARAFGPEWSWTIPSYADIAGYLLAAGSFLALGPTLRAGGHIRVTLLLGRLPQVLHWAAEVLALTLGLAVAVFACGYSVNLLRESLRYGDTSSGILAIPLWLPQSLMVLGLAVLVLALADTWVEALRARRPILRGGDEA